MAPTPRCRLLSLLAAAGLAAMAWAADALPPEAHGTFVQRKHLADVDVTLTSKGRFRFVRDRSFEWEVREPMPSVFLATPTNYAVTVAGRTSTHALNVDVTSIGRIFEIKEMKEFVKEVKVTPETGFPTRVRVIFKNGDRLEIELNAEG